MIDIGDDVKHVMLGSFADDTRAWKAITNTEDFQDDLNVLYEWAVSNNGEFNGKKFDLMAMMDDSGERPYTQPGGTPIRLKQHVKDLGVYMSDDCTFNYHINNVVKKAQQMSAWVLRTFRTRSTGPMLTLLKQLVISTAEYASVLWSPVGQTNINKLENIQKRFTSKFAIFRRYDEAVGLSECITDYWERLEKLKLYSLQRRRDRY